MTRRLLAVGAAVLGLLVFTSAASAATLGITAPPGGAGPGGCGQLVGQYSDSASTPYLIPAGGGQITQWQTYTVSDTAGSSLTFVVLKPTGGGNYTVVGVDTRSLPNPLPTNNIASFTLSNPIQVAAGETLALYTSSSDVCYFYGGSTPSGDVLFGATGTPLPPTAGETVTEPSGDMSTGGYALNLAVTLVQPEDAGVQTSIFPSITDTASASLLSSIVTNGGPGTGPITFTDQVPAGFLVQSATGGTGSCAVAGQTVTCVISGLGVGQSTQIYVVAKPSTTGSYVNNVSVGGLAPGVIDPNAANNTASAALAVTALPQECIVPGSLRKVPQGAASTLLTELGCVVHVGTPAFRRQQGPRARRQRWRPRLRVPQARHAGRVLGTKEEEAQAALSSSGRTRVNLRMTIPGSAQVASAYGRSDSVTPLIDGCCMSIASRRSAVASRLAAPLRASSPQRSPVRASSALRETPSRRASVSSSRTSSKGSTRTFESEPIVSRTPASR